MKISRVVWMMVLFFLMSVIAAAQGQGQGQGQGPPPGADPVNCNGCVGTGDIADGAIGTSKIDPNLVQRRVVGGCAIGSIALINADGTVICGTDEVGITAVTASAPLVSSGGSSPHLSLPGVILDSSLLNTAVGNSALFNNSTGRANTASGFGALSNNTTGDFNTATGVQVLLSNTTGSFNTASGVGTLLRNTSGGGNTVSGVNALLNNTTGSVNTASGSYTLHENTTGSYNTASGGKTLHQNTTGSFNTAIGSETLWSNTTGNYNSASGTYALLGNTTGEYNTAFGTQALWTNTTGSFNTALGFDARVASGDLVNATAIGAQAVVDASHKIRLGNPNVSVIEAQVGLTVVSDATKKENFQPVDGEAVLHKIQGLSLTSWNLIGQDPKHFRHYGPIAQEFFAAFGSDGVGTIGNPTTITSTDMDGILMVAAQALEKRTAEQTQEVARLKARLETLEAFIREALPQR